MIISSGQYPNRLVPNWATLYGIQPTPMQMYCTGIKGLKNKLPRGMESKCNSLRKRILSGVFLKEMHPIWNDARMQFKRLRYSDRMLRYGSCIACSTGVENQPPSESGLDSRLNRQFSNKRGYYGLW